MWTSPDGQAWSRVPHDEAVFGEPTLKGMASVAAGGPGLVGVGTVSQGCKDMAAVWTSPDGQTWSRVPPDDAALSGASPLMMWSVTSVGSGLVAVGEEVHPGQTIAAAVWTSPDGQTWSRVSHDEAVFGGPGDQSMASVTAGGTGLVAVGEEFHPQGSAAAVWIAE